MEKKSWKTLFLCSGLSKFPLGLAQSACSFGALSEISQSEQVSGCCVLFDIVRFLGHCLIGTHMSTPCSSISEAHRLRLEHRLNFCSHSWETKTRVEQLLPALCFYPLLSRILTHTYNTFLPLFSLQSHNEWFHPRTPPPLSLSLQLIPEAPRFPLASFFVLSHFIPMLHSNRVIFFFLFFSFFPLPLSRFSIWASKGLQGLIWCLSLSPQLVCGLRANCRVWSVCELIKISRSPQCSCPLSLQSTSPRYV